MVLVEVLASLYNKDGKITPGRVSAAMFNGDDVASENFKRILEALTEPDFDIWDAGWRDVYKEGENAQKRHLRFARWLLKKHEEMHRAKSKTKA